MCMQIYSRFTNIRMALPADKAVSTIQSMSIDFIRAFFPIFWFFLSVKLLKSGNRGLCYYGLGVKTYQYVWRPVRRWMYGSLQKFAPKILLPDFLKMANLAQFPYQNYLQKRVSKFLS